MSDYFGAPSGSLGDPSANSLSNDFSNIGDRSIDDLAQTDRVIPRQVSTGVTRGTQRISNTDGSYMTLGVIPETTELGMAFYNADNTLNRRITGDNDYFYDTDGNISILIGYAPGIDEPIVAIMKEGFDALESITN
jgi:hypothetical protein